MKRLYFVLFVCLVSALLTVVDGIFPVELQDKTRQRGVTDAGTTVPLSPHLQGRYSDDNIYFIQLKSQV